MFRERIWGIICGVIIIVFMIWVMGIGVVGVVVIFKDLGLLRYWVIVLVICVFRFLFCSILSIKGRLEVRLVIYWLMLILVFFVFWFRIWFVSEELFKWILMLVIEMF